eukprot:946851_1
MVGFPLSSNHCFCWCFLHKLTIKPSKQYDYARVENELNNLKPATNCNHGNEINQIHCNHIGDKKHKCQNQRIDEIMQSSKKCLDLYRMIKERRVEMNYIIG